MPTPLFKVLRHQAICPKLIVDNNDIGSRIVSANIAANKETTMASSLTSLINNGSHSLGGFFAFSISITCNAASNTGLFDDM